MDIYTKHVAFDKTLSENGVIQGQVVLLKKEHYEKVLQFLKEDFFPTEYVSKAINIPWSEELANMFIQVMEQRISLIMLDKESSEVMGIRLMGFGTQDDIVSENDFDGIEMKQLIAFRILCDETTRFYERYNIKEAVHYFGLGTAVKYRNMGVGTALVDLSLKFLKNLNISPIYVKAEASSLYPMRIFEKLGFELIAEVKYEDYKRDGQIVIKSTDDNYCMKAYAYLI